MKHKQKIEQLYQLFLWLISPLLILFIAYLAVRDRSWRSISNRFAGGLHADKTKQQAVWVHCASVGEVNTALPLIKMWLQAHPQGRIVVTTTTVSAARLLKRYALPAIHHYYLPLDYSSLQRRFIRALRPRCLLVVETEIWLGLFSQCHRQGVPVIIINARLSQRSLRTRSWLGGYFRASLAHTQLVLARSQNDHKAYQQLGMAADKIELLGNLKYASVGQRAGARLIGRDYYLAASTHQGEDEDIVNTFCASCPAELLVLAPRYPRRGRALYKKLKKRGVKVQLRTQQPEVAADTTIYIADTLGELSSLICYAQWVFMGGSLRAHGGHNVIEPAAYGVVQVTGPDTSNFAEETAALLKVQGLTQVQQLQALAQFMQSYKNNKHAYRQAAQRAQQWVQQQSTIAQRYYQRLHAAGVF